MYTMNPNAKAANTKSPIEKTMIELLPDGWFCSVLEKHKPEIRRNTPEMTAVAMISGR